MLTSLVPGLCSPRFFYIDLTHLPGDGAFSQGVEPTFINLQSRKYPLWMWPLADMIEAISQLIFPLPWCVSLIMTISQHKSTSGKVERNNEINRRVQKGKVGKLRLSSMLSKYNVQIREFSNINDTTESLLVCLHVIAGFLNCNTEVL